MTTAAGETTGRATSSPTRAPTLTAGHWAVALVPFAVGAARAGMEPAHLPLAACWAAVWTVAHAPLDAHRAPTPHSATRRASGAPARGAEQPEGSPPEGSRSRRVPVAAFVVAVVALAVTLVVLPDVSSRTDIAWCLALVTLALAARHLAATRRGRTAAVAPLAGIVAACTMGVVAYLAGYPAGGTIATGRRAIVLTMLTLGVLLAGFSQLGPPPGQTTPPPTRRPVRAWAPPAIWWLITPVTWAYAALSPHRVAGIPTRTSAFLAAAFAALTLTSFLTAGRPHPRRGVKVVRLLIGAALAAALVVWR